MWWIVDRLPKWLNVAHLCCSLHSIAKWVAARILSSLIRLHQLCCSSLAFLYHFDSNKSLWTFKVFDGIGNATHTHARIRTTNTTRMECILIYWPNPAKPANGANETQYSSFRHIQRAYQAERRLCRSQSHTSECFDRSEIRHCRRSETCPWWMCCNYMMRMDIAIMINISSFLSLFLSVVSAKTFPLNQRTCYSVGLTLFESCVREHDDN